MPLFWTKMKHRNYHSSVEEIKKLPATYLDILCVILYFKSTDNFEYRTRTIFVIWITNMQLNHRITVEESRTYACHEGRYIYKWSRYRPGVAQRVGRGKALLFHNRGTRRGWVVSSTPRPRFTPGKDPVPILQEAGWAPGPVWTGGKISSQPGFDHGPSSP